MHHPDKKDAIFQFDKNPDGSIKVYHGRIDDEVELKYLATVPAKVAKSFMMCAQAHLEMFDNNIWTEPRSFDWLEMFFGD